MASRKSDPPTFLIVAGPNGSGKSTAYETSDSGVEGRTFWIVNPDRLTARLQGIEGLDLREANLKAVQRLETWLTASIDVRSTIGVETVLSTDKYRKRYHRSMAQMPWFLDRADRAWLYDNSGASLRLVGRKQIGTVTLDPRAPDVLLRTLNAKI